MAEDQEFIVASYLERHLCKMEASVLGFFWPCPNQKFRGEKVTYVFRLFVDFFRLSSISFSYLFAAVAELLLNLLTVHELSRRDILISDKSSVNKLGKFCSALFTNNSKHFGDFGAYFRLNWPNHSNFFSERSIPPAELGYYKKWCRFWSKLKQKWNKDQHSSWAKRVPMG